MSEPIARTVKDFCRAYSVSRSTVYRLLASGHLQAVKASATKTLIPEESAKAWFENLQDVRRAEAIKREKEIADIKERQAIKTALEDKLPALEMLEGDGTRLYRHFDKYRRLLYVGISLNVMARLSQHRSNSSWFEEIVTVKIETFTNREAALAAEKLAILKEGPLYNSMHNDQPLLTSLPTSIREIKRNNVKQTKVK